MSRGVFTILAIASLLLCVVTCVLWSRSYATGYYYVHWTPGLGIGAEIEHGEIEFWSQKMEIPRRSIGAGDNGFHTFNARGVFVDLPTQQWSFVWRPQLMGSDPRWNLYQRSVVLPAWFAVVVLLVLPLGEIRRYRARRHVSSHAQACMRCGYDLRATPDRCPECGVVSSGAEA